MKKIISLIFLVLLAIPIFAQFGVKAGMNSTNFTITDFYNSRFSFYVGGTYDQHITTKSIIQYELAFNSIGADYKKEVFKGGGYANFYSLELPVRYLYDLSITKDFSLIMGGGGYFRYGLFGKEKRIFDGEVLKQSSYINYNRPDLGLTFDLGLSIKKIDVLCGYKIGFTNTIKNSDSKTLTWSIGLGYKFL